MMLSFLEGRKVTAQGRVYSAVAGDPLGIAKAKIIRAINSQKSMAEMVANGGVVPKKVGGRVSIWFFQEPDGKYWTALRYGQSVIPLEDNNSYVEVGTADDLVPFYDSVIEAVNNGEMDAVIQKLRSKRSAAFKRRGGMSAVDEVEAEVS